MKIFSVFLIIIFIFTLISGCSNEVKESKPSEEADENIARESVVEVYPTEEIAETQEPIESTTESAETAGSTSENQTDYAKNGIRYLSQNTALFSLSMKYVTERVPCINDFIKDYDVCCLQEVFDYQDKLLDRWHKEVNVLGKNNSLPKWHQEIYNNVWPEWGLDYVDVGENNDKIIMGVKLVDERPNKITSRIVFGPYCVLGPKSVSVFNGGLLILSKFPIILTSAFVFEEGAGVDAIAAKGVLYARIKTGPSEGDYVHVFNTHLQAHNSQKDKEARKNQVRELFEFIEHCITVSDTDDLLSKKYDGKPVMIMGDFNIIADTPVNWGEKALISSPPQGETNDMSKEIKSDEYKMLMDQVAVTNANLGINLVDSWSYAYPQHPGFTWIGKGWQTSESNPYGELGNVLATESDVPQRIDYIFFYDGGLNSSYYLSVVPGERKYYYFGESNIQAGSCQTLTKDEWLKALMNKLSGTEGEYDLNKFSCTISDHLGINFKYMR